MTFVFIKWAPYTTWSLKREKRGERCFLVISVKLYLLWICFFFFFGRHKKISHNVTYAINLWSGWEDKGVHTSTSLCLSISAQICLAKWMDTGMWQQQSNKNDRECFVFLFFFQAMHTEKKEMVAKELNSTNYAMRNFKKCLNILFICFRRRYLFPGFSPLINLLCDSRERGIISWRCGKMHATTKPFAFSPPPASISRSPCSSYLF